MKRYIILLSLFIAFSATSFSQDGTDEQLAAQYFQDQEYDKAAVLYEKLFNKAPRQRRLDGQGKYFYEALLKCLIELKEFKKAEKLVSKQQKNYPDELTLLIDLGEVYSADGDKDKATQEYKKAVRQLGADHRQVIELASAFLKIKQPEFAIETYEKGQKLLKGLYPYNFELASIYAQLGETEKVLEQYLDALTMGDAYVQAVQNNLATYLDVDDNSRTEMLKSKLLERVQKNPGMTVYSEMLIWYHIQQNEFNAALIQARALDKRLNEDGSRIIALAELAANNRDYKVAAKCYEYVLGKGQGNFYYIRSRINLLGVKNKSVVENGDYTEQDLVELEGLYNSTIAELGKYAGTVGLLLDLAHLKAFYMGKHQEAINLLEETIKIPGSSPTILAQCKLELGDIYLISGDVWESALYYGQVDKAFKHEVLGQEAKFRNARLSYFRGEFGWAQAQLDVLKAATNKLIANDAMQLSLLITENLGLDTVEEPLQMFANAQLKIFMNKHDEAIVILDSIGFIFPNHYALDDDIVFTKGKVMENKGNIEEAIKFYDEVVRSYSYDILADDALFRLAEIYQWKLRDEEKAMEYYKKLMFDFPGSLYAAEARKRFRKMRGDEIN